MSFSTSPRENHAQGSGYSNEVVEQVKDTYTRLVWERKQRGAELPVRDLGSREDFDLKGSVADQINYERCRYSCEATDALIRKAGRKTYSANLPWKK